jgi:hypothetical protein
MRLMESMPATWQMHKFNITSKNFSTDIAEIPMIIPTRGALRIIASQTVIIKKFKK